MKYKTDRKIANMNYITNLVCTSDLRPIEVKCVLTLMTQTYAVDIDRIDYDCNELAIIMKYTAANLLTTLRVLDKKNIIHLELVDNQVYAKSKGWLVFNPNHTEWDIDSTLL